MKHYAPGILTIVIAAFFITGCAKARNEWAVERLRLQILNENFEEIYENSSNELKAAISREEFVEKMKGATAALKELDPSLTWHDAEDRIDRFWSPYEAYSYKEMMTREKPVWIGVDWNHGFKLCGLSYGNGVYERVFRSCD